MSPLAVLLLAGAVSIARGPFRSLAAVPVRDELRPIAPIREVALFEVVDLDDDLMLGIRTSRGWFFGPKLYDGSARAKADVDCRTSSLTVTGSAGASAITWVHDCTSHFEDVWFGWGHKVYDRHWSDRVVCWIGEHGTPRCTGPR